MPEQNVFETPGNKEEKKVETRRPLHSSDFIQKIIKPQHIDGIVIKTGLAADKPDGSTHCKSFFAEDESKLYIYNETNSAWESVTLS